MSDSFSRTTHQSYGSRISGSCKALCLAPIFLVVGICVLGWNEGNLVTQRKVLDLGLRSVIDVETIESIDSGNEGRLIHFVGPATPGSQITDPIFGVEPPSALLLKRKVEMYQWVESHQSSTQKKTGGSTETVTTYSYTKEWKDEVVSSATFAEPSGHQNPSSMLFRSDTMAASPIHVGAFELSNDIIGKMKNWYKPLQSGVSTDTIADDSTRTDAQVFGNSFYFGSSDAASSPEVGDTHVSFEEVPSQTISVVAIQMGGSLSAYTAPSGGSILLVESGPHDAAEMFQHANQALTAQTWLIRLVGFLFIFVAFAVIMKPLSVFADVLPFVGDLVEAGTNIISLLLAGVVTIVVVALSWLFYRPIFSIILLGAMAQLLLVTKLRLGERKTAKQQAVPLYDEDFEVSGAPYEDDDLEMPFARFSS